MKYSPITKSGAAHEGNVPYNIHVVRVERDNHALHSQMNAARFLDHRDTIAQRERLRKQPILRMGWQKNGFAWNAFDDGLLECVGVFVLGEIVCQLLDRLDGFLGQYGQTNNGLRT